MPVAEEESPVADVAVDEGKAFGTGVFHVGADVEKIFEEPEGGEGEAIRLTLEIEVDGAEKWDEKFTERAAEEHEGVPTPGEKEMAGLVDHEVDEIGKEEAGGVAEGVEEEERVREEPGDACIARDGVPVFGFGEGERHGTRVTAAKVTRGSMRDYVAWGKRD